MQTLIQEAIAEIDGGYNQNISLQANLATLFNCSIKSNNKISGAINEAKTALGITGKTQDLSQNLRFLIWDYHRGKLANVENVSQGTAAIAVENTSQDKGMTTVEDISQNETTKLVEDISQTDIEAIAPPVACGSANVEDISQAANRAPVENASQPHTAEPVEDYSRLSDYVAYRFRFSYTTPKGDSKSDVIALEGYFVNTLMALTGMTKAQVPVWISEAVSDWMGFDYQLGATKQIKKLIMRKLEDAVRQSQV